MLENLGTKPCTRTFFDSPFLQFFQCISSTRLRFRHVSPSARASLTIRSSHTQLPVRIRIRNLLLFASSFPAPSAPLPWVSAYPFPPSPRPRTPSFLTNDTFDLPPTPSSWRSCLLPSPTPAPAALPRRCLRAPYPRRCLLKRNRCAPAGGAPYFINSASGRARMRRPSPRYCKKKRVQ